MGAMRASTPKSYENRTTALFRTLCRVDTQSTACAYMVAAKGRERLRRAARALPCVSRRPKDILLHASTQNSTHVSRMRRPASCNVHAREPQGCTVAQSAIRREGCMAAHMHRATCHTVVERNAKRPIAIDEEIPYHCHFIIATRRGKQRMVAQLYLRASADELLVPSSTAAMVWCHRRVPQARMRERQHGIMRARHTMLPAVE